LKSILVELYKLQLVDLSLDDIFEIRGDLPQSVTQLEARLTEIQRKISEYESMLSEGTADREQKEKQSNELLAKIETYKKQQLAVKTNKQYDALTKEIETAEQTIDSNESDVEHFIEQSMEIRALRDELKNQVEDIEKDLEIKRTELQEIMTSTIEEENVYLARRKGILKNIDSTYMEQYNTIRGAKNGKAIVPVVSRSCGGCYNVVPPQLVLEIRKDDRVIICEHCGRILISEAVVNTAKGMQ
jgi:uncharacterized protein